MVAVRLEDDGRIRVVVPRNRDLKDTHTVDKAKHSKTTQIQAISTDLQPNEADFRDRNELWNFVLQTDSETFFRVLFYSVSFLSARGLV